MTFYSDTVRDATDRALVTSLELAVILLLAAWFSNLPIYANLYLIPAIAPTQWIAITGIILALLSVARNSWRENLSSSLLIWWIAVMLTNLSWFIAFGGGDTVIINSRVAALAFLAIAYFAFSTQPHVLERVTRLFPWLVLLAVFLNAYNLANPFAFVPPESDFALMVRAAGIYINPNTAGSAIVLGMLLSMPAVAERWMPWFVCISAAGVAMTLSRGAILMFLCVCMGLVVTGILSRRVILKIAAIAAGAVIILIKLAGPTWLELLGSFGNVERVLVLLNPDEAGDFSTAERVFLAEQGWIQFVSNPLTGNGVGSTETWTLRGSTHNQYLQLMSDFGILGLFIIPALALVLAWGRSLRDVVPLGVAGCVILWSFLSHNVLTEYFWLLAIAVAAATPPACSRVTANVTGFGRTATAR